MNLPERLPAQRELFAVPDEIAYFNTANLAPHLHAVRAAGEAALDQRGRPWTITPEDWFTDVEHLRGLFGRLIGGDADGVALIPATSYGFTVAAQCANLSAGRRVLVLAEEYPSGIYTWRRAARHTGAEILTVAGRPDHDWTKAVLAAIDETVAVVSVPNVHWTDGTLIDLVRIAGAAHDVGALLVIDGSQSVGALPLDVDELRPDFVISVGYKWLLGPFGRGYMWIAEPHRGAEPVEENWISRVDSEDFARLVDYRDDYQPGARRFDVGQRTCFELTPMAIAALEQILDWGVGRIASSLERITTQIADSLSSTRLEPTPAGLRSPHMLGVQIPESKRRVIIPALEDANCYAALRGSSLRIAPHLHTTIADIDRLVEILTTI
ncbi:aminotransferase class V-fold PLP-dependent enzyme [Mycobacterium sp. 2YAF39]|uniref:aminotransferase class V-fold PLP-dependent enzyme n=1 Tax=Mycobacterium sp. 2YAF39 TaxID=3233033 RepID=UPI003F96A8C0